MQIRILPSLLAADFGHLADEARRAEAAGADSLHLDIMDAHFVPNLSMGPNVVAMARKCVDIRLNVHLMMTHPDKYIEAFAEAGSDTILIHVEADCDVKATLARIREKNIRAGVTLNPKTPAEEAFSYLEDVSEVLCMTVEPGYGGQSFMPEVLPKIRAIRDQANAQGLHDLDIVVDGGINLESACACAAHGANGLVAGTFLYGSDDMAQLTEQMRRDAAGAFFA
jgi:ribulose-phosphate 3-epimerase